MWPFNKKEKIPLIIFLEIGIGKMVSQSPFLDESILTQIGDRRILGEDVLKRLKAEIVYFSIFLVTHFCITRPYGLKKKAFNADELGELFDQILDNAFTNAPAGLHLRKLDFTRRYKYYVETTRNQNPKGGMELLVRAFALATLVADNPEATVPNMNAKLDYLLVLGDVMFDTTDEIVGGLLKNKEMC